jgi:L-lactate dehydrogenase complex protein LldG
VSRARDRIFARISGARAGKALPSEGAIRAERDALLPDVGATQPTITEQNTVARFKAMAMSERLTASVDEIGSLAEVPDAVDRYLQRMGLPLEVAVTPVLANLEWRQIHATEKISANQAVAVTLADGGIAETGSLIFRSRAETPMLHNFLALHHIAVVRRESIARFLEAAFDPNAPEMPRIFSFITGTSGTADIEAVNIRGAHGPRYLHILIVDGSASNP